LEDRIPVRIFGVPIACSKGVTDVWRNVANQASGQLRARFGDRVLVEYYDLLSPETEKFPQVLRQVSAGAQIPLVFVGEELISSGGKVSVPAIARRISELLNKPGG